MTIATDLSKDKARVLPLAKICMDSGNLLFSKGATVETEEGVYSERISSMSQVVRQAWLPWGSPNLTNYSIVLDDGDLYLAGSYNHDDWMNRVVILSLWVEGNTQTMHTGTIENATFSQGTLTLEVVDSWKQYIGDDARWHNSHLLLAEDWAGLDPDWVGKPGPAVVGILDSIGAGNRGTSTAVPLSGNLYLAAIHAMDNIYPIWVGGEEKNTGFTLNLSETNSIGIDNKIATIDFEEAPSGSVTFDGRGLTDDLDSTGAVVTNLVDQAELLRKYLFNVPDSLVDADAIALASTFCTDRYIRGSGVISDDQAPMYILHSLIASGYLFGGITSDGLWKIWSIDQPIDDSGGLQISEVHDIVAGSWATKFDLTPLCNHLTIRYRELNGKFYGVRTYEDSSSQTDLARIYKKELRCPFINDWDVAVHVAHQALRMQAKCRVATWSEHLQHAASIDLGSYVSITNIGAPASLSQGWSGREFMVTSLAYSADDYSLTIEALDVHAFARAQIGEETLLGDDFGEVLG